VRPELARKHRLTIRLTDEEIQRLQDIGAETRMPVSAVLVAVLDRTVFAKSRAQDVLEDATRNSGITQVSRHP
jgi:hypothetical protein